MGIYLILVSLALCFGLVVFFGAPYLPTLKPQTLAAYDLLNLRPGQTILELGCGDGSVMIEGAKRGLRVIGYELNPILALVAWARTRRYKQACRVVWGNFWVLPLLKCDGVFVFLHTRFMEKLDQKITQEKKGPLKLASFAFKIPAKKAAGEKQGVYLYEYR